MMKAKQILAVGAAGVSLLGSNILLASIDHDSVVYAEQAPDGQFTNGTTWKYLNGKNGYADYKFESGYVANAGSIAGYTHVKSERDGHNWVHYFNPISSDSTNTSIDTSSQGKNSSVNNTANNHSDTNNGADVIKDEYKWLLVNGKYHLYINNNLAKGWQTVGEKTYYLEEDGSMKTGILEIKDKRYYLDENGVQAFGWVNFEGKDYYITKDGSKPTTIIPERY